jgi:hypothetical protein
MALTPDEQTKLDSILKSEDGRILQSWKDSLISNAIRATLEKNPGLPDVAKRIETIKSEYDKKTKQLEINNLVLKKCYEKGVNYKTIESLGMQFSDEKEIDTKLSLLQKDIALKEEKDWNELVSKNSFRPGTGVSRDTENTYGIPADQWSRFDKESQNAIAVEFAKKNRKY